MKEIMKIYKVLRSVEVVNFVIGVVQVILKRNQININSVKEYTVKIKVDTTELDCAIKKLKRLNKLVTKNKLPRVTVSTHGNLDEKKIIELLGKY